VQSANFRLLCAAALIAAQLFAPLAHRVHAQGHESWSEICTGAGIQRLPRGGDQAAPTPAGEHCWACRVADRLAGPTIVPLAAALDHAWVVRLPRPQASISMRRAHWRDPPARAPPALHTRIAFV
jgi:hypothetical protein